jgi:CRISPR/Cas system-associated exonuclease Cas4 (RecB family)
MTIEEQIFNGIIKKYNEEKEYKPNRYWVSELCLCIRKAYYNRKIGRPNEFNGAMLAGSMFHEIFPNIVKEIKEFDNAEYEVKMEQQFGDFVISGRADIITPDCVYDIKYSGSKEISEHYKMQANGGAVLKEKPSYGVVLVNSRDLHVDFFKAPTSQEMFGVLLKKALALHNAIKEDSLPQGFDYKWECGYCPFIKSICPKETRIKALWA